MSKNLEFIQPEGFAKPRGYANGVVTQGRTLHVGGQIGWNASQEFESDDFAQQFAQALDNVVAVVRAAGGQADDVASMTIFVINHYQSPIQFLFLLTTPLLFFNGIKVSSIKEAKKLDPFLKQMAISTLLFILTFGIGNLI